MQALGKFPRGKHASSLGLGNSKHACPPAKMTQKETKSIKEADMVVQFGSALRFGRQFSFKTVISTLSDLQVKIFLYFQGC